MATDPVPTVKAFLSYAWSSEPHEAWVLDLAGRLTTDGVEVLFDKWDLKVGHDANAFMEKMVTDPSVTKVLMICDRTYKEKADGRMGGVGKETTILTSEIYEKTEQNKYAALLTEYDESGKGYVPAYYGGRQYIDFADTSRAEASYQELLRWIFGKPKHVRPPRGSVPSFITNPDAFVTRTTSKFKAAEHAIRANAQQAGGFISDFGEELLAEFRANKPVRNPEEAFDDTTISAANKMRPALRHLHELILAEARFGGANIERLLRIFERMGSMMYRPPEVRSWNEDDFDAYRMMCYEGFLGLIAIFISEQRFDLIAAAVIYPFFIPERERGSGPATVSYRVFSQDVESFRFRKNRLQSNQIDLYSDLIAETYKLSFPALDKLFEADLLLYLRGSIANDSTGWEQWWPRTLLYARRGSLELFARSESLSYFNRWAPKVFGEISVDAFKTAISELTQQSRQILGSFGPSIASLTNSQNIGSRA